MTVNDTKIACTGWRKIPVKSETAGYLTREDPVAAKGILTHDRYGKSIGCWK